MDSRLRGNDKVTMASAAQESAYQVDALIAQDIDAYLDRHQHKSLLTFLLKAAHGNSDPKLPIASAMEGNVDPTKARCNYFVAPTGQQ